LSKGNKELALELQAASSANAASSAAIYKGKILVMVLPVDPSGEIAL
jgi:hypothetical protein